MVSARAPTSKSSSPFSNPLVTIPNAPIPIGIIVTSMFHRFFNSLAKSRYLSFFSHSFSYILWSAGTVDNFANSLFFFFVDYYKVFWPRLGDPCVCQSPIGVYVCHFQGQVLCCAFFGVVKFKFLAHFPVDHHADPVVSRLILLLC